MGVKLRIRGLAGGLVVTGFTGFALAALVIYSYVAAILALTRVAHVLGLMVFTLACTALGIPVLYFASYSLHVGVDSALLLYEYKVKGLRGLETCVREK